MTRSRNARAVRMATAYDDASPETITFTLPEDLTAVDDAALAELLEQAVEAFTAVDEADSIDADAVETMTALADAAEAIRAEQANRETALAEARAAAEELRKRINPEPVAQTDPDEATDEDGGDDADEPEATVTDEEIAKVIEEETAVVAGAKREPVTLTVPTRRRAPAPKVEEPVKGLSLIAAADLPGIPAGAEISVEQAAEAFAARSRGINPNSLRASAAAGKRSVQSFQLASVKKQFPADLIVASGADADEVLKRAVDTSRLPGGSLVASGAGWCSPSQVLYELAEDAETTDGMFSLPEVQVDRGGLRHTLGPDFSSIYGDAEISWNYTETEVEEGDYDGYGGGTKPCYFVDCPEFVDDRLDVAGVCIRAGLLMNNAYPEVIQRVVRGALVAHEFKQAGRKLAAIAAGSTAVTMPANPMGATSPILDAIELQTEDYRQRHRISRQRALEAVFPNWVRGAIRSDLSRRLGVDMMSVSNEQINGWFAQRGVNAQFVYELDDLTGNAASRTAWPTDFKFLLYLEGTWIGGTSAVITLESVFDSALIEQNIYTQLFTEEGWLVAKRFHDSRVVTVNICTDGMTRAGFESVETGCGGSSEKVTN